MDRNSYIIVRRYPYEEPLHLHLDILVSNGVFSGGTDFYCNAQDPKEIGKALQNFPIKVGDEYRYEIGSQDSEGNSYVYFLMRVYVIDSVGHCAIQFAINKNTIEPHEGACRFSIKSDAAAINRLGNSFDKFSGLEDLELNWSPALFD